MGTIPILADKDQGNRELKNFKLEGKTTVELAAETSVEANLKYDTIIGKAVIRDATNYKPLATTEDLTLYTKAFPGWDTTTLPTASDIVITNSGATQTLVLATINGAAISSLNPAIFYTDGAGVSKRWVKTAPLTFTWTKTNGIWFFYFDNTGTAVATQAGFPDFNLITPLYRFYYNAADDQINTRAFEAHPNDISAIDHEHKHRLGAIWYSGLDIICNKLTTGSPSATGLNTCISISPGSNIDDNLKYSIANSYPNTATSKLSQNLGIQTAANITNANAGLFKISYNDSNGFLKIHPATRFPFLWNNVNNKPQFITATGVATDVTSGNFFVYFLYSLQDDEPGEALRLRSAVSQFNTKALADAYTWTQAKADSITLRDNEIRQLYKIVFEYRTNYDVAVKYSVLRDYVDYRTEALSVTPVTSSSILASNTIFTPESGIVATNAQTAIVEVKTVADGKVTKATSPVSGNLMKHDASGNAIDTGQPATFLDVWGVEAATITILTTESNWTNTVSVTATGVKGQRCDGTSWLYECVDTDTWKRTSTGINYLDVLTIPSEAQTQLTTTGNWNASGVYIGSTIIGCYKGQMHYSLTNLYLFVDNNIPIRLTRT